MGQRVRRVEAYKSGDHKSWDGNLFDLQVLIGYEKESSNYGIKIFFLF